MFLKFPLQTDYQDQIENRIQFKTNAILRQFGRHRMLTGVGPENLFNLNITELPIVCEKPSTQLFSPDVYKKAHLNKPYNDSIFNSLQFKMLPNRHRVSGDFILMKNRL
ncbi:unnamed protein product [Trichobilharzia szidati]|nr:unnamed protein product [Trichobilharzia szidati]